LKPASVLEQYLKQPGTVSIGRGRLTWAPVEALASVPLPQPEYQCNQPLVEVVVQRGNGSTLLFLANSSAQDLAAQVTFAGSRTFRAAWGETQTKSSENNATFLVPAYSVQIWEVA
jgi:hypothetical protein